MKANKGKEFIPPDEDWSIIESKCIPHANNSKIRRFHIKKFNRKLRRYFKKVIRDIFNKEN